MPVIVTAALAIVAAAILFGSMVWQKKLTASALLFAGIWYAVWIILVFPLGIEEFVRNLGWGV